MAARPLPDVAVVMCTWRRPELLEATLACLEAQGGVTPKLFLWNNNPAIAAAVDDIVGRARLEVSVYHHDENIGGFGRFYQARALADRFPYVVFIDDDQTFGPDTLKTLLDEARPQTVAGWWAFRFTGRVPNYWLRRRVKPGYGAHYIGTCGMIIDSSIFNDRRLYDCPAEFWFIEDLWLCFVAQQVLGWKLVASRAQFAAVIDLKNQAPGLVTKKTKFLKHLVKEGWSVTPRLKKGDLRTLRPQGKNL